ncbi:putative glutamate carboxypeptidase AMP1 [Senna tora]|uniref:Aminopeptidase NAALADL1 n=1 Tax=Senna tora TaxID=362788 RepID=A0A834WFE1_9FABA|nr:putative glutamate carboxypeptidase AMP1 [Senna tora]
MVQFLSKPTTLFAAKPSPLGTFIIILILCILSFRILHYPHHSSSAPAPSTSQNASHFRHIFLSSSSNFTIASYLRALTLHPHLAGTKLASETARYVLNHFRDMGLQAHTVSYTALLSYPLHSSISAHFSDSSFVDLLVTETGRSDVVPPYHAYSPSGSAYAKAVFVNYGRQEDYRALGVLGVNVSGCIVIARKGGGLSRGAVVETAEANGAVAVLTYADGDRFRKGFERGHVMRGIGDPLSPGWGGIDGGEKLDLEDSEVLKRFPKIPSMPLSAEIAETILYSLGGAVVPQEWKSTIRSKLRIRNVGPGPTMLNFTYQGEKKVRTIQNVFATIKGLEEPDRYVLLGNHRDAWTYGAVDPSSGTAALLDIARRYSLLLRLGWTPRRTIILCSWDAEEFGMIGSTEWVEQNLANLGSRAVAYLNVDCAVQGSGFFAGSTPQLDNLLLEVKDPDSEDATMYENWAATNGNSNVMLLLPVPICEHMKNQIPAIHYTVLHAEQSIYKYMPFSFVQLIVKIQIMRLSGLDSDFAPFVQHAGVPSIDVYYGRDFPVYHTAFDSYNWMTEYGDPFFKRHVAVAGVWGLLALRLADDSILPFNYHPYVDQLQEYKNILSNLLDQSISLDPLANSIKEFASAVKEVDDELKTLRLQETAGCFLHTKRRTLNDRLMLAEKGFLDAEGLQGRKWFKHLVFGPPRDHASKMDFFPGIADSMAWSTKMTEKQAQAAIRHEIWRLARAIQRAASALRGEFT